MLKERMLISIIIPYYKKKKFITKTLNSIKNQSYKYFEAIIVYDDEDLSDFYFIKNIIHKDSRFKIYKNLKNKGVSKSRNFAISKSKGHFISFIDSDDVWNKDKLKFQLNFMLKNRCLISHTNYNLINTTGNKIGQMNISLVLNHKDLLRSCDIGTSTVMINSKIKKLIKFSNIETKEDFVLWLKLSKRYKFFGIQKNLVNWRKVSNSLSSSLRIKFRDAFFVYFRYEKFNFIKSIFFVLILSMNYIKKSLKQIIN